MHAAIGNVFSDDNKGGSVLTQAAIELIKGTWPDASISLLRVSGNDPNGLRHTSIAHPDVSILEPPLGSVIRRYGGLAAVIYSMWLIALGRTAASNDSIRSLAAADLVFSKGGHVFVDRRGWRGLLSLWVTAFPLLYGKRCGAETVALGATIGPFKSRASRALASFILRRVTLILPRDSASADCARAMGLPQQRVRLLPDGVFAFNAEPNLLHVDELMTRYQLGLERFGVVTTGYPGGDSEDFLDEVGTALNILLDDRSIDRVLIPLHTMSASGESTDRDLSQALACRLQDGRAAILEEDLSPSDLMELYRRASFVMGRRLHSTLFGIVAGTPSLAIIHPREPAKALNLFDDLNLRSWVADVGHKGELLGKLRVLLGSRDEWSQRAAAVAASQRRTWENVSEELFQVRS